MKKIIVLFILLFIVGCSTVQYKSEYSQTASELEQELKNDNLTPVQKVIIKHAITELKQAQKTDKENTVLNDRLISESKKSGAGTFAYGLLLVCGLGIIAFIIVKIKYFL
mgnify:CR=1 FL=1